jgi:[ribosomal protein S5]-alanine N-acetyltransferase
MKAFAPLICDGFHIVPFEERHLTERYVAWLNDPDVVKYSEQRHRVHDAASCRDYFLSMQNSACLFAAIEMADSELGHVGNISVAIDRANRSADVSIIIGDKRVWGTGLASAAWTAMVDELLKGWALRRVTAGTMSVNLPRIKLMTRSGMTIDAVRARHFLWEGQEVDLVLASKHAQQSTSTDLGNKGS